MKKRSAGKRRLLPALAAALLLCACGGTAPSPAFLPEASAAPPGEAAAGATASPAPSPETYDRFTPEEIEAAAEVIRREFPVDWPGYRLIELRYAGDQTSERRGFFWEEEAMVLLGSMQPEPAAAALGMDPERVYTWEFVLFRNGEGLWQHRDRSHQNDLTELRFWERPPQYLHSQEDIDEAMAVVTRELTEDWEGYTLHGLCYPGDKESYLYRPWAEENGAEEVLVLCASVSAEEGLDDPMREPGRPYVWKMILVRDPGEPWRLVDHARGGTTRGVRRAKTASEIYTPEEIDAAMDTILREFAERWHGCTFRGLSFLGDENADWVYGMGEKYNAAYAIRLHSSFDVDASGGDGTLNPNGSYGFSWTLVRRADGSWWHVDHGY